MTYSGPDHEIQWAKTSIVAFKTDCHCGRYQGQWHMDEQSAQAEYDRHIVADKAHEESKGT